MAGKLQGGRSTIGKLLGEFEAGMQAIAEAPSRRAARWSERPSVRAAAAAPSGSPAVAHLRVRADAAMLRDHFPQGTCKLT
jgi:hypothetical protein